MAFYIELRKISSSETSVSYVYEFSLPSEPTRNSAGKLRASSKLVSGTVKIDKATGDVEIIKLADGDNGIYVQRASLALLKLWKNKEYPDKTYWVS